jgi:hypothetical protein
MAATVRIAPADHEKLVAIAKARGVPMTEALALAVEAYRRKVWLEGYVAEVAAFRDADPTGWAEDMEELRQWETTDMDGLRNEPPYPRSTRTVAKPVARKVAGRAKAAAPARRAR